ncbi:Aldo/keto reductase family protein [Aquisphaera giovannonii]|uniref:Aldo/keto reductase family protein n=1 Tax=Aquisphaera giovannonii TaxID=406548 RepID=A0A5B9VUX0_9BACT|nr:aldo/keto reductase [Aquisphaera giovannonii]QEH31590.1 Aldo/keto reductase family protein [Aquisphaera giovannonii]
MADDAKDLSRRDLMRLGAAGVAAAGVTGLPVIAAQDAAPSKLPTRRYGRTGLEIGWLVGASDWPKELIPRAVNAGVNYWHKAQVWTAETMPPALKRQPRESYFLECVVDRVSGDHTRGKIDEEQHYQFVKNRLKASGVGYYDVFKFHFGYHSVEEAKSSPGMVRAFERLKKEGLVKHLAISQHHYPNIGGDMAWEIMNYLADKEPYEATQFFYTYNDRKEVQEWIDVAKKKDIGTIAMKTMGGVGRAAQDGKFKKLLADPKFQGSTPAAAMVKWLRSNENLTAAVIATKNFDQFRENSGAAAGLAMAPQDREALGLLAAYNKGLTCLLCAECVSACPEHIGISDIFRYERYARDYHELDRARAEYASLTRNGTSCAGCGDCLPSCPQEIDIAAKLKDVHKLLG